MKQMVDSGDLGKYAQEEGQPIDEVQQLRFAESEAREVLFEAEKPVYISAAKRRKALEKLCKRAQIKIPDPSKVQEDKNQTIMAMVS
jgi:hypothetical protein